MTAAPRGAMDGQPAGDVPEFRPHRTSNAHGFPCETPWRLLGDVIRNVIDDAAINYMNRKDKA